jgi:ribulose 1,5-bisphosphate synthetase/thiazole synthase
MVVCPRVVRSRLVVDFTGHSMGGAVAAILAARARLHFAHIRRRDEVRKEGRKEGRKERAA